MTLPVPSYDALIPNPDLNHNTNPNGMSGGCADGVVVCLLDVWELYVPVGLLFVADQGEHKGNCVVDEFDAFVGARVVGACGDCVDDEVVVEGERDFGT